MISTNIAPEKILFFDIETVPQFNSWESFEREKPELFNCWLKKDQDINEQFDKIGLLPEYSKIVCISVGAVNENGTLRVKSYTGKEDEILEAFFVDTENLPDRVSFFSGHNIKEFDIPFIVKRCTLTGSRVPMFCRNYGRKPWELGHILDTMEIWRCGSFKGNVGLETLSLIFGVENPKEHVQDKSVAEMYRDNEIGGIKTYCEADVFAQANVYCAMTGYKAVTR